MVRTLGIDQGTILKKNDKLKEKIFISIYFLSILKKLLKLAILLIVLVPFNGFDKRLITSVWAWRLKENGIEINEFSIFQRGLSLGKPCESPKWFKSKWLKIFSNWFSLQNLIEFNADEHTFEHSLRLVKLRKIIVRVDNSNGLECLLRIEKNSATFLDPNFTVNHFEFLEPYRWTIN